VAEADLGRGIPGERAAFYQNAALAAAQVEHSDAAFIRRGSRPYEQQDRPAVRRR